ncbi:hypothetical protein, partial [Streptomyces sp. NPDC056647]
MKQYIESNMLLFKKTLTVGPLTSGNDISILAIPSVKPTKNLDMSRNYIFAFQILVRHLDQYKSYT